MIKNLLGLFIAENETDNLKRCFDCLELSFITTYVDTSSIDVDELDPQNFNARAVLEFLDMDGIEIVVALREKYARNYDIFNAVSRLEQKYFLLDRATVLS